MSIIKILKWPFRRGGLFHPTKNHSDYIKKFITRKDSVIINIGSGGSQIPNAINIDPYRGGPNTIKAFGEDLPFENNSVDLAICVGTLEHTKNPALILNEIYRVLKPGGEIYIEMPFLQPFHSAPGDYSRLTLSGLLNLCLNFKKIDTGIVNGPGSAIAWFLVEYIQLFSKNRLIKNSAKIIFSPLKYLDIWLIKNPESAKLAGGFYFYGKK